MITAIVVFSLMILVLIVMTIGDMVMDIKFGINGFILNFWGNLFASIFDFLEMIINLILGRKPYNRQENNSGTYYSQNNMYPPISPKSRLLALILCITFGVIGLHRLYVGKIFSSLLYMLTFGLCGIGWIIDIFLIIFGVFKDSNGLPLKQW